jgi:hypothetical protein
MQVPILYNLYCFMMCFRLNVCKIQLRTNIIGRWTRSLIFIMQQNCFGLVCSQIERVFIGKINSHFAYVPFRLFFIVLSFLQIWLLILSSLSGIETTQRRGKFKGCLGCSCVLFHNIIMPRDRADASKWEPSWSLSLKMSLAPIILDVNLVNNLWVTFGWAVIMQQSMWHQSRP